MNLEDIKKKQKKVMVYVMLLCIVLAVGASYAYFTSGITSEDETTVTAEGGTMKINYNGGNTISLSGIYPRDEVWATKIITVTGNNTTDAEMYYKLNLVVDSNTFRPDDPLEYELISINTSDNGKVVPAVSRTLLTKIRTELGKGNFLKTDNAVHTYQLKIYYPLKDTDQNGNQGSTFNAHIEIESAKALKTNGLLVDLIKYNNEITTPITTPGKEVSAHTLDDVESQTISVSTSDQKYYVTYGTGWKANGTKFDLTGTAVTSDTYANSYSSLVGKYLTSREVYYAGSSTAGIMKKTTNLSSIYYVVSATEDSFTYKVLSSNKNTTEAILASTEDDYGTSYYFRGAVKNNYVEFANKCWRIVRITGDGSVKLILHNDNINGVSNPCSSGNNRDMAAFAFESRFNSSNKDNTYVGLMYGQAGASDYASTHANTNKSTILTNLETWYENNLLSYEDKLADTIWCNDKSGGSFGYQNNSYYGAYKRLNSVSTSKPKLICPYDNNGGKLSKFTVSDSTSGNANLTYKIGLLTADEITLAGYITFSNENESTYLSENGNIDYSRMRNNTAWWTLSPYSYDEDIQIAYVYKVLNGMLSVYASVTDYARPAIALAPNIEISGGTGTSEDPYIVN